MLRATRQVLGGKGTPDYWNKYDSKHGWPKFVRYFEHSRKAGGYRAYYKDKTYAVRDYESGDKFMSILLLEDNLNYGSKGEICRLPKLIARSLISKSAPHPVFGSNNGQKQAVHATQDNIKMWSAIKNFDDPEVGIKESIPLRRLKMKLNRYASKGIQVEMRIPLHKEYEVSTKHIGRCLAKNDIGVASVESIQLEVNGHLKDGVRSWSVAQLSDWSKEQVIVIVKMNNDELNPLELRVPITFVQ